LYFYLPLRIEGRHKANKTSVCVQWQVWSVATRPLAA
jgi:hypothetical protein